MLESKTNKVIYFHDLYFGEIQVYVVIADVIIKLYNFKCDNNDLFFSICIGFSLKKSFKNEKCNYKMAITDLFNLYKK